MTSDPGAPGFRRPLSRRSLLLGAAGVGVLAGGAISAGILALEGAPTSEPSVAKPTMTVRELLTRRAFLIAHRGGSADWPEMSEYAYQQSVARGYQALEMSVARSADGVWFGLHDRTLDRTSGTVGFVAAEHTWAEISAHRINAAQTRDPGQPARPYFPLHRLLLEFGATKVLFLDPKAADPQHYPELLDHLSTTLRHPTRQVVAKSPGGNVQWARLASAKGYRTWGFYADHEVADGLLAESATSWDLLGADVAAADSTWTTVRGYGKPVLASVISTPAERQRVLALGAAGLVVSDVEAVQGEAPSSRQ